MPYDFAASSALLGGLERRRATRQQPQQQDDTRPEMSAMISPSIMGAAARDLGVRQPQSQTPQAEQQMQRPGSYQSAPNRKPLSYDPARPPDQLNDPNRAIANDSGLTGGQRMRGLMSYMGKYGTSAPLIA
jgi:hypothetical protein